MFHVKPLPVGEAQLSLKRIARAPSGDWNARLQDVAVAGVGGIFAPLYKVCYNKRRKRKKAREG